MTTLVDYGIQNEQADYRAHVCPMAAAVYLFPVDGALIACQLEGIKQRPVFVNGQQTATGFLVPPRLIPGMRRIEVTPLEWRGAGLEYGQTTDEKGRRGEELFRRLCLNRGLFRWPVRPTTRAEQLAGIDLIDADGVRIQVKVDYHGGEGYNTSGNLFLQTAERRLK